MKLSIWIFFLLLVNSVNSISDNEEEDDEFSDTEDIVEKLPEHEFITSEKTVQTGKNKGTKKYITTLLIPPYTFKRKADRKVGGNTIFTCNSCAKLGYTNSATAIKVSENEDGKSEYELTRIPEAHKCVPSSTAHLKKEFTKALYDEVAKNPLVSDANMFGNSYFYSVPFPYVPISYCAFFPCASFPL